MPPGTIPPEVLAALIRGATILTASQRVAHTLHQAYQVHMRSRNQWTPPEIYALDTWFTTCWHQLLVDGSATALLLNRTQQHALWRAILAADRELPSLRPVDALADLAARAWHLLHLHNGAAQLRDAVLGTDSRAFGRWSQALQRLCLCDRYLTPAELPAALEASLAQGDLLLPEAGLVLLDFDLLPPATAQLFESIERAGYPVQRLLTSTPTASATLYPALDDASELHAAATWARDRLQSEPAATIAIVVPNLGDRRAALERIFAAVLPAGTPYELSLGTPLSQDTLAATALDLLRWTLAPLPLDRVTALLLSPSLIIPGETLAAAEFDAHDLRAATLLRPELSLNAFLQLLRASPRVARLPALHGSLRTLRKAAAENHLADAPAQSHAHWATVFRALLKAAASPPTGDLDSITFQVLRRWESALDELAALDFDGTRVPPAAALQSLDRIVHQTIFAPESRVASIQILGPLEVGGTPVDRLWFLAADESSWPSSPAANPLLPWRLQRDLGIPGADSTRDTAVAQALTARIFHSATEVVFSYAVHAEAAERRPSPLLAAFNLTSLPLEQPSPPPAPLRLELHPDDESLPSLPSGTLSGGAQILELQAACPFRAFAERRLFATAPDSRVPGLDARDRGSLVHIVMQAFWSRIQTQAALKALTLSARQTILDDCITRALQPYTRRAETSWDNAYLEVQRRRLHSLLAPWLDFELTRPPFTVDQQETELRAVSIGPLALNLRVDRIDLTAAGPLILDYKTGVAAPSEWLGERPDAPQVPLYAVLAPRETLAGVAFALLRPGEDLCLKGFADDSRVLTKPTRNDLSLPDQREAWHDVLTNLATAFHEGDTRVDPKCYPNTCQYCAQRTLCRLDPSTLQDLSGEEDDSTYVEAHP